ncbi:hypothetical protein ABC347_07210 [Sphingomonas sp. 1P06PA]|uniref:hypothetical protein n=1 Tax=Sphingomonas sp. 1P06PA TaxID=554121 RepID=UPI0039A6CC84
MRWLLALLLALSASEPSKAAWMEASSDHFLIYANASEDWLRSFSDRLERFDGSLRAIRTLKSDPGLKSNRLTIFVVDSVDDVSRLCGRARSCAQVAGFYVPRVGGSLAYTPRRSGFSSKWDLAAQTVLLHEYTHHFMFQHFAGAYPAWFAEGFAEFNGTARFEKDGGVTFGAPPLYRAYGLLAQGNPMPAKRLLVPTQDRLNGLEVEAIYGRGWLLTHYLLTDSARTSQLDRYLRALSAGTAPLAAATTAFGDLDALDKTLDRYKMGKFAGWTIRASALKPGPIAIRSLSEGEAALMPVRMRSQRGVNEKSAETVVREARRRAAPFPADAAPQTALAEAEYDADQLDAALAAAERAIAASPTALRAHLYKGRVLVDRAAKLKTTDPAAWKEARSWYLKANKIDPNNAEPLLLFYQSFAAAGQKPTVNAVRGLERAFTLSPEDRDLRWLVARQFLVDARPDMARMALVPLAYDPHLSAESNPAAILVSKLAAGKTGPAALAELDAAEQAEAAKKKAETPAE